MHYLCPTNHSCLIMNKNLIILLFALVVSGFAHGQLPQFSSASFEEWVYTNPAVELNRSNILANRIYLYTTSQGLPLTLSSPLFTCRRGAILDMNVTLITDQWQSEGFVTRKVALTATILDGNGVPVDSVTYTPREVNWTNSVNLSIVVPDGLPRMKVRFASWKADVGSNGAVRQIEMNSLLRGDLNHDGAISISDINAMIGIILTGDSIDGPFLLADMNGDGSITIADINCLIDLILS